jgi:hypothetical protein
MSSGLHRILPRVRVSGDTLRISLLVAAGVTSGYLWRAALEPGPTAGGPLAPAGNLAGEALPPPPTVRITVPDAPAKPRAVRQRHVARKSGLARVVRPRSSVVTRPARSTPAAPSPKPRPTPPPPPSTPPPAPPPGVGSTPVPSPPVVAAPATAPEQAASTETLTPSATTPAPPPTHTPAAHTPASPTPAAHTPASPTPAPPADDADSHPGWGHGDKNHDHSGPKGRGG